MNRAADFLPDVLADAFRGVKGFQVEVYPGAERRGRTTGFYPADPRHGGVCNHHTGRGGFDALLAYMAENSRIAPLTNWSTSRPQNGIVRVVVVAMGRANHAGRGGTGRGGTSWVPTNHGNTYLVGNENQNDGGQSWPGQQVEGIHIATAAVLDHLGHDERRAVDHKNYAPRRKVDRHSVVLAQERAAIAHYLNPAPKPQEDGLMAADVEAIIERLEWIKREVQANKNALTDLAQRLNRIESQIGAVEGVVDPTGPTIAEEIDLIRRDMRKVGDKLGFEPES